MAVNKWKQWKKKPIIYLWMALVLCKMAYFSRLPLLLHPPLENNIGIKHHIFGLGAFWDPGIYALKVNMKMTLPPWCLTSILVYCHPYIGFLLYSVCCIKSLLHCTVYFSFLFRTSSLRMSVREVHFTWEIQHIIWLVDVLWKKDKTTETTNGLLNIQWLLHKPVEMNWIKCPFDW